MSWQASHWARDQHTGSPVAKAILMVLAEQAAVESAVCTLSAATIGERAEAGRGATLKHLAALEGLGLISRTRRFNPHTGHRMSDEIRLNLSGEAVAQGPIDEPRPPLGPQNEPRPRSISEVAKVHLRGRLGSQNGPHIDKGLEEGFEKVSPPVPRKADVEAFWAIAPKLGRQRSSRKEIERALAAAVRRGHDPGEVLVGVKTYYASDEATKSGGQYARACHRVIENDRWEAFAPVPVTDTLAKPPADPWRDRVRAFADPGNLYWNATDWGPAPGKPGCIAPAAILAEFCFGGETVIPFSRKGAA